MMFKKSTGNITPYSKDAAMEKKDDLTEKTEDKQAAKTDDKTSFLENQESSKKKGDDEDVFNG